MINKWLDISSAVLALIAAFFWFASVYGKIPPMLTYYDGTPPDDPYYQAVTFSIKMNKWAAAFSGLSALSVGIKLFI